MKTRTWSFLSVVFVAAVADSVVFVRHAELEYAAYDELRKAGATGDDWVSFEELITGRPPIVQLKIPANIAKEDAFRCLRHMHNLESLTLAYDSLTDDEISTISTLRLNSFTFTGNYPTDESVPNVLRFSTIRFLYVPSGNLSAKSVQRLQRELPSVRIEVL